MALFIPFGLTFVVLEFAPSNNVSFAVFLTVFVVAIVVGEVSSDHFLIGAVPDAFVVLGLRYFSRNPNGVVKKLPLPVDIDLESKFASYKITIEGVIYEANGRTYPEWLKMIEKFTWTPAEDLLPRPLSAQGGRDIGE